MSSAVARNGRQWELCSTENGRNKGHSYRFGATPTVDYSAQFAHQAEAAPRVKGQSAVRGAAYRSGALFLPRPRPEHSASLRVASLAETTCHLSALARLTLR